MSVKRDGKEAMTIETQASATATRPAEASEPGRPVDADAAGASIDDALHLAELEEGERRRYLEKNPALRDPQMVISFCRRAAGLLRMDLPLARRMVEAACTVADCLGDDVSSARAARARAQLHHIQAEYSSAFDCYSRSIEHYENADEQVQAAITRSCGLHVLALLGRFDMADDWGDRARDLFTRMGDRVRLARLDANTAVVLHRQHDFEGALRLSLRAYERLRAQGTSQDVAVTLRNMLVCHVGLRNLALALDVYERARNFAERHRFPRLVLESDYNIAYVHQMSGDYEKALFLYGKTRARFQEWGDPFHEALCDLDQSEAHLDIRELDEAETLAGRALEVLERLEVGQEAGRALVHLAIVAGSRGRAVESQELLERARETFRETGDPVWARLTDLYRALVFELSGQVSRAIEVASAAREASATDPHVTRRALFDTLVAYLEARRSESKSAADASRSALESLLGVAAVPKMPSPAWLLSGAETKPRLSAAG